MARKKASPRATAEEPWIPTITPSVAPNLNYEAADPRIELLVEIASPSGRRTPYSFRLTADEAEGLARDLARQVAEARGLAKI